MTGNLRFGWEFRKTLSVLVFAAACAGLAGIALLSGANATPVAAASPAAQKSLRGYFVGVEGGEATLFFTPEGQSLLIDTGWDGNNGRDADRIVAAAKSAGLSKIDYVLITHFHEDHVGGAPQLAARIPIGAFIDHGENRESTDAPTVQGWQAYQALLATGKFKRITPKPGDVLPIQGMRVQVISADGALISNPLPGAGQQNAACKESETRPADKTENLRSLGTFITFGKLRLLDLGDLTWDKEMGLMCPVNKLGHVDVYIVSHHGWQQSSSPALVWGIAPRVAIMDNGAEEGGAAHNVAAEFIANPQGTDAGNYLELIGNADGGFEVFDSRTQSTKKYPAR